MLILKPNYKLNLAMLLMLSACTQAKDYTQDLETANNAYITINKTEAEIIILNCNIQLNESQKDWKAYRENSLQKLKLNNKIEQNKRILKIVLAKLQDDKYPQINALKAKYSE